MSGQASPRPHRSEAGDVASGADDLAEFAVLMAQTSLGTPESLDNQRRGQDLAERLGIPDDEPAIDGDRLFAVALHLQANGLHGAAELTYQTAAKRGSDAAVTALIDLLHRDGGHIEQQAQLGAPSPRRAPGGQPPTSAETTVRPGRTS